MNEDDRYPQTFVEYVLSMLKERLPWLSIKNKQEVGVEVSGADVIDEHSNPHREANRTAGG